MRTSCCWKRRPKPVSSAWLSLAGAVLPGARRRAPAIARRQAWPVLLALAAMCFPLNTHYAFYSSWWGLFFWWLLAVAAAALYLRPDATPPSRSAGPVLVGGRRTPGH